MKLRTAISDGWAEVTAELSRVGSRSPDTDVPGPNPRVGTKRTWSTLTEASALSLFARKLTQAMDSPLDLTIREGQAIGARASEIRARDDRDMVVITLRWFPPNLYRAYGYRLKLRDDVRRLSALTDGGEATYVAALFVDLNGIVRSTWIRDLASAHPRVDIRGYSGRSELPGLR